MRARTSCHKTFVGDGRFRHEGRNLLLLIPAAEGFEPFLLHDGSYANLETIEDVFTVGLNRAVTVLADKQAKGPSGRGTPAALKDLGEVVQHPCGQRIGCIRIDLKPTPVHSEPTFLPHRIGMLEPVQGIGEVFSGPI